MATVVKILGQDEPKEKKLKKIEFVYADAGYVDSQRVLPAFKPGDFKNIELVSMSNNPLYYDIMFAYNKDDRTDGIIYYGHFNDGIV